MVALKLDGGDRKAWLMTAAATGMTLLNRSLIGNGDDLRRPEHPVAVPITVTDDGDDLPLLAPLNRLGLDHFAQADHSFAIGKRDLLNAPCFQHTPDLALYTGEAFERATHGLVKRTCFVFCNVENVYKQNQHPHN